MSPTPAQTSPYATWHATSTAMMAASASAEPEPAPQAPASPAEVQAAEDWVSEALFDCYETTGWHSTAPGREDWVSEALFDCYND